MADIDLKTSTPDTSLPTTGFLFGADSQAASAPSVYSTQTVATTLLGSTSLTGATITASAPVLDLSQTWNNGATTFTALKFNITDTASAAASLLMDLQVGGTSKFKVAKDGSVVLPASASGYALWGGLPTSTGYHAASLGEQSIYSAGSKMIGIHSGSLFVVFNSRIGFSTTANYNSQDLVLTRRAAANLQLGAADAAAPVAQTLSVQSGTAGASALSCSISGTTLTVGGAVTGTIAIGHAVTGTGVSAGTVITAGSGTTWTVNNSQTVSSTTMYFNSVGQNLTITGSQGSGPSAGGSIVFQVAPAGSAGTTAQNALATALTIGADRSATFAGSIIGSYFTLQPVGYTNALLLYDTGGGPAVALTSNGDIRWSSSATNAGSAADVVLRRDAPGNILALRNGANAQAFRVYNTYTSDTNYESGRLQWVGNEFRIGPETVGGTLRSMGLYVGGTRYQIIGSNFNQFDQNIYMNVANIVTDTSTGFKIGTGTTQKIGFWNATPIAQPTTAVAAATVAATGTGDVVAASTTFDGYTIPQIVKALRNAGLLA